MFQACCFGERCNIRRTTSKSLEDITVSFEKHIVEIASHPHDTSIVQPPLSKGTFFQLLFFCIIRIIMQISKWNYGKSHYHLIDPGLVWQVHILPKFTLFHVCLTCWGNPAKHSDLLSLLLHWAIHWNCSSNAFDVTQGIPTILPVKLLNIFYFYFSHVRKFCKNLYLAQSLWPFFFFLSYFQVWFRGLGFSLFFFIFQNVRHKPTKSSFDYKEEDLEGSQKNPVLILFRLKIYTILHDPAILPGR